MADRFTIEIVPSPVYEIELPERGPQGLQGPKGDTGATGPAGPAGPQGPQGEKGDIGPQGIQGVQGPKGDKGDSALTFAVGETVELPTSNSAYVENVGTDQDIVLNFGIPRGLTGPTGATGPQGPKGDVGPTGPQGQKGDIGPIGPIGPQGPKGDSAFTLSIGEVKSVDYTEPATVTNVGTQTDQVWDMSIPRGKDGGADIDLSNLSEIGLDKLNTSKMYTTGTVSEDTQGYTQIQQMNHSTFDLSKFTVVGSPTITDDGIASGFSSSNYLESTFTSNATYDFELVVSFTVQTYSNAFIFGNIVGIWRTGKIISNIGDGQKYGGFICDLDKEYIAKVQLKNGYHILNISGDNGKTWIQVFNVANTNPYTFNKETIGNLNVNYPFLGSIDLKQLSITVDGKEVFSGNKTGLDVIKPDNYTVIGTPTISEDGVASGFSSSNYVKTTYSFSQQILTNFEIDGEFSLQSGFKNFVLSCDNTNKKGVNIMLDTSGLTLFVASSDGTDWAHSSTVVSNLQANKTYIYKILLKNGNLTLDFAEKGSQYVNYPVLSNVTGVYFTGNMYLGCGGTNSSQYLQNGSIDLNAFKIYVDGNLVYQPCLKIPYTESKTGSKIVDVAYRDRVIDLYEQEGQAGYYTIDEENQNFTLPMGEIYGMVGQRRLISSTVTETNRVDIYSDRTCLICGNVATAGTINLPIELVNNNYFITLPTSAKTATSFTTTATGDYILIGEVV